MVLTAILCLFFKEDTARLNFTTKRPFESPIVCTGVFKVEITSTTIKIEDVDYNIEKRMASDKETIYIASQKQNPKVKIVARTEKGRLFVTKNAKITVYE